MCRRIAIRLAQIPSARDDLAVAHNHRAERIVASSRLVERKTYEAPHRRPKRRRPPKRGLPIRPRPR